MTKRYYCDSELSFNIRLNGRKRHIIFNMLTNGGSEYITANMQEQIAIERVRGYGSLFKSTDIADELELVLMDEPMLIDVPEVMNCADAKLWLRNQGVKGDLNSRVTICEAAVSLGYSFSNL